MDEKAQSLHFMAAAWETAVGGDMWKEPYYTNKNGAKMYWDDGRATEREAREALEYHAETGAYSKGA